MDPGNRTRGKDGPSDLDRLISTFEALDVPFVKADNANADALEAWTVTLRDPGAGTEGAAAQFSFDAAGRYIEFSLWEVTP